MKIHYEEVLTWLEHEPLALARESNRFAGDVKRTTAKKLENRGLAEIVYNSDDGYEYLVLLD